MKELVSQQAAERVLLFLAVGGPVFGLTVEIAVGVLKKRTGPYFTRGLLIGGLGTLVYGLWRLYNAITNAFGIDSLANLTLQLVMFAIVGAVVGIAAMEICAHIGKPKPE